MIVADTNLVAHLVIHTEATPRAERVRARDKFWAVPALFVHEWLNVLGMQVRQGLMDRDRAARQYRRGMAVAKVRPEVPDALTIFQWAKETGCTTYDLDFVWLARALKVPLVTSDQQVLVAFPDVAVLPSAYA